MHPTATDCLLVMDVQNDFLPGGALAVPDGDRVIPAINRLARAFGRVVLTQDWHPRDHVSFAANHPGMQPFSMIDLPYGPQVLWPVHCVQHSTGAALADGLDVPHAQLIVRKGYHQQIDSYSALFEADRKTPTACLATCASWASGACSASDWPRTSAWRGRRWMRGQRGWTWP